MKIGFSPESIVDLNGMPLVGRVTLYLHDSDTKINVYTLEGSTFTAAANPQLLNDAGRLDNTLFFDSAIVDVNVERYIGADGMMSVDSPDEDFEQFDNFEIGFNTESLQPRYIVDTIDELKDADVSAKYVQVMGYYAVGDCVPRSYVWDADSQDTIDGGYVVGSNNEDSGRWILLWNGQTIPSSVYGVIAGSNETNINAFVTYPAVVGSFLQKTAQAPRFEKGNYTKDVTIITAKDVAFDRGAKFANAEIQCASAIVDGGWSSYIADLTFSDGNAVAHSSWFKTVDGFLTCGAFEYIVDSTNYFVTSSISSRRTLTRKKWVATSRLPVTYSGSGCMVFNGCAFVGSRFFNANDIVAFANTVFTDDWFDMTASDFDFVNKITCRSASLNTLLLANFKSVDTYIKAITANGETSVDLAGRSVTSLSTTQFTDIRNAVCGTLTIDESSNNVALHNVTASSLSVSCNGLTIDEGSCVNFSEIPSTNSIEAKDSVLTSSITFSIPRQIIAVNCEFGISINEVTDNVTVGKSVKLENCNLKNCALSLKSLSMERCKAEGCTIKIYPYKVDSEYRMYARLVDNTFDSSAPVEFTKVENDDSCYGCIVDWTISGNSFVGNSEGIRCRYWANRTGLQNTDKTFISFGFSNKLVYSGNNGNVPSETATGIRGNDTTVDSWYVFDSGSGIYVSLNLQEVNSRRVFPDITKASTGAYHYDLKAVNNTKCIMTKQNEAEGLYIEKDAMVYPIAAFYNDENGSLFDLGLSIYEQVSTATAGQVKTWEFI